MNQTDPIVERLLSIECRLQDGRDLIINNPPANLIKLAEAHLDLSRAVQEIAQQVRFVAGLLRWDHPPR